ncbi:phytanoyl-CoA dioxygenase family protein [Lysobacter capsici]|uniref:phytanoyl-CoA dioxygenase family protein n=1 Tax=Lysobacter capsici TaxID=435897 RepID=UPI001BFFF78D|nr:phytanoyl-CoA dioxygenase family protein [Lysobacter capsici]QWF17737.1 phytanoyl-CoA dioxygenase family protein [Lysobacter capsici]
MKSDQAEFFAAQGYLRLDAFHPKSRMAAIRRNVLDEMKRLSARTDVTKSLRQLPFFQQIGKLSALVNVPGLHDALATPELIEFISRLGGQALTPSQGTQLLLSPPNQGDWTLKGLNWHVDVTSDPLCRLAGIQAFFLIDDVAPRGGATLALAGSHRVDTSGLGSVSALRRLLKTSDNLERNLRGSGVSIVEMSGRAGDICLMDMRLLHTPSINASKQLRMMATCRCFVGA